LRFFHFTKTEGEIQAVLHFWFWINKSLTTIPFSLYFQSTTNLSIIGIICFGRYSNKKLLTRSFLYRQNGLVPTLDEWNWENLDLNSLQKMMTKYPETVRQHIAEFAPLTRM
jgi:hypothetical protein